MVTRHRVGRSVYYQLTDTGRSLLALLAGEDILRAVASAAPAPDDSGPPESMARPLHGLLASASCSYEADALRRTYTSRTGSAEAPADRDRGRARRHLRGGTGELFGLLGPNGAGKTTTIKMLNTLLLTSGTARVFGHDVARDPVAVRRRIGYVFGGDRGLYDRLSALDNLRYFAELYGVEARDQKRRIAELLDLVGLVGREKESVEGYSRGMRQRLHIARGLLHRPDVLFLDEPSIGVDPVAARDLRRTVADLAAAGTTVLLTTHYMAEATSSAAGSP
ncbi:ABC transporter ATP-binding protein [Streptomyces narbonensis]